MSQSLTLQTHIIYHQTEQNHTSRKIEDADKTGHKKYLISIYKKRFIISCLVMSENDKYHVQFCHSFQNNVSVTGT